MKKIPVKYIVFSGLATIIGGFFHACTESQSFTPDWVDSKPNISLRTDFRQNCSCLYIQLPDRSLLCEYRQTGGTL